MRVIHNPVKWMLRRGELITMRAKAIKDHKAHADIDRELIEVTAALIAWQDRREAKAPDWIERARQTYARNYFELATQCIGSQCQSSEPRREVAQ